MTKEQIIPIRDIMIELNCDEDIIEVLAEIEHEQWVEWSKDISQSESLSPKRIERWKQLWVPYRHLYESDKHSDRAYANKVMKVVLAVFEKERKFWADELRKKDLEWKEKYSKLKKRMNVK